MRNLLALTAAVLLASGQQVQAQASDDTSAGNNSIEEVTIYGTQDSGETSVGRNSLDPTEQARAIQVFDADLVQQIKPKAIEDIVTLSSNVLYSGNSDGRETRFTIRGFDGAPVLRDGFRVASFGSITDPETFNLERIEVLKGPDSIVYGEAEPGGIINLVTKRPKQDDHTILSLEVGDSPSVSPRVDVNRAFSEDLAFRVVALYDRDEGFRNYENDTVRKSLAPSARWEPQAGTVISFIGEYVDEEGPADFGTVRDAQGNLTAPISQVTNHPTDTYDIEFRMTGLDFEQQINDSLTAEARIRYFDSAYDYSFLWLPGQYDPASNTLTRVAASQAQEAEELAAQINLFGNVDIGGMQNRFTFGLDYRETETANGGLFGPGVRSTINWANPDYSQRPLTIAEAQATPGIFPYSFDSEADRLGLFFQNHTDITDNLLLSLGVRYDEVDLTDITNFFGVTTTQEKIDDTVFQASVRYTFSDAVNVFVGFSESYTPNTSSRDRNGQLIDSENGEGLEIGLKGVLDSGFSYTLAIFDITKENVAAPDTSDGAPSFAVVPVNQDSQGIELDVSGPITEALSVTGSIGYSDTKDFQGNQLPTSADWTSSAYFTYTLTDQWDASLGWKYVGDRPVLDEQWVVNAGVGYTNGPWRAQINITNLLDDEYIETEAGGLGRGVEPGSPREALLTITYEM